MTTLPIELANAREARTEAWNEYQLVIDRPHTPVEFHRALYAAGLADDLCADLYERWQAVGGTSDIESIYDAELEQEKHKALQIVLDVTTAPALPPSPWRYNAQTVYTRGIDGLWTGGCYPFTDGEIANMFEIWKNPQRSDRGKYTQQSVYWTGDIH